MSLHFNVIIPTRDRADTLVHCLKTIVAQDYERLQIFVSDNASEDHTRDIVHSFDDDRIQYLNTEERLSMSKNWEFALRHVEEGWVTYLGDDDGLFPWAIETLNEQICESKVEAVCSRFGSFRWPGHFDGEDGSLSIPLSSSSQIKSTRRQLAKVFCGKAEYYTLPWLYHGGAASLDLINRARHPDGHFFCSQIPDVYSAMALSHSVDRYLRLERPIAINGASRHSNGTAQMGGAKSISNVDPFEVFKSEQNIPFHDTLVLGKSLQVLAFESYLQSAHIHGCKTDWISLEQQLGVAAGNAAGTRKREIVSECDAIALKNDLTYHANSPSIISKLLRKSRGLVQSFWTTTRRPREIGVLDVGAAAQAAAEIDARRQQNAVGFWSLHVSHLCRKAFSRIFRSPR